MGLFQFNETVDKALVGVILLLFALHLIILLVARLNPQKDYTNIKQRMNSWWFMIAFLALLFIGNIAIGLTIVGILSFLALCEFYAMVQFDVSDRWMVRLSFLAIPVQLYLLYINWIGTFYLFVPLYVFFLLPLGRILTGNPKDFIKTIGIIQWGLLLNVYCIGYLGAFLCPYISETKGTVALSGKEVLLFLLIANTINDAAQYFWGKTFGKRKITPGISPHKTWFGFLGGVFTTTAVAILLAPYLAPIPWLYAAGAGLLIACFGFVGDVTMSAVKRDVGVKDSSNLIPGHGGVLDRLDSLTYSAPLLFHYLCFFFHDFG